jgi:hypothetical protein
MMRWHLQKLGADEAKIGEEMKKWEALQIEKQKKQEALREQKRLKRKAKKQAEAGKPEAQAVSAETAAA